MATNEVYLRIVRGNTPDGLWTGDRSASLTLL